MNWSLIFASNVFLNQIALLASGMSMTLQIVCHRSWEGIVPRDPLLGCV